MSRSKAKPKQQGEKPKKSLREPVKGDPLFDTMVELDRLEELLEEMSELGITSVAELEARIGELEAQIDDAPDPGADGPV
jgi:hypothetical protein